MSLLQTNANVIANKIIRHTCVILDHVYISSYYCIRNVKERSWTVCYLFIINIYSRIDILNACFTTFAATCILFIFLYFRSTLYQFRFMRFNHVYVAIMRIPKTYPTYFIQQFKVFNVNHLLAKAKRLWHCMVRCLIIQSVWCTLLHLYIHWSLSVCVRAWVRAWVLVCVRAYVRGCVRVCVRACVCFWITYWIVAFTISGKFSSLFKVIN